ncbi:hypothetical protein [Nostoc parmelioides]|nr:hypothetical protein [Nostoc parmelioides]
MSLPLGLSRMVRYQFFVCTSDTLASIRREFALVEVLIFGD